VDNLCHTLTGAALGEAGLKRTTPFARATLMIAANLPDIDVLVFATSVPSVAFRRGWTHGLLAQALLPLVFAGLVFALGRRRGARLGPLVLLSYAGVLSHVALDLLNNYGVRLLMPFSPRWFYGDAVFIVDIWLWLALGGGTWYAARRMHRRSAWLALGVAVVYIAGMVVSARVARDLVRDEWRKRSGREPVSLMVGPVPITPLRRQVVIDAGREYAIGYFDWRGRQLVVEDASIAKNDGHPAVQSAIASNRRFRDVLTWARFPYYTVVPGPAGDVVTLRDLRFGERVGAARAVVAASPGSARPADRSR
jgi:inner membrane protein